MKTILNTGVKDDRATPAEPTVQDYRRLLVNARKMQLRMTRENVARLERTYDNAAESLKTQLLDIPAFMLDEREAIRQAYLRTLLLRMESVLDRLRIEYADLLNISLLDSAQTAAKREDAIQQLMTSSAARDERLLENMTRTAVLADGSQFSVQFGRVALSAVEATAKRVYRDGLVLSDRLYKLDRQARHALGDVIVQAVAEGTSASRMADRVQAVFIARGEETPRYQAVRIARTEIRAAHVEGHLQSIKGEGGALRPYLVGVRFALSSSHRNADICDIYAAHDSGLGTGVYLPNDFPVSHPNCLCASISVLREFPEVSSPRKKPDAGNVPASQVAYYATNGDRIVQAFIGANG